MTASVMHPVYPIVDYVWDMLLANELMDPSDYGGIVPIVPLNEEPELQDAEGPYLVYGYAGGQRRPSPERQTGSITFAVYSQNFRRLTSILNAMEGALGREDDSAKDLNRYTSANYSKYPGIRFGYITLGFVEGGSPDGLGPSDAATTEGGRQSGIINFQFEYLGTCYS